MRNVVLGIIVIVLLSQCSTKKKDIMNTKKNKEAFCDEETGICAAVSIKKHPKKEDFKVDKLFQVKLIYYYDALCGWCYGFSSVLSKIDETYGDKLNIEVVSGGLFLNNRTGLVNDVAPHIKQGAYKSVEARTGVKFGEAFLKDVFGEGKMKLNSLPPSIALCIVKEKFPEKELEFAEMLLHAVYFDGMNPTILSEYTKYVEKIGLNKEEFFTKMKDDHYMSLAEKEFKKFRESPFSGMPALVLETENRQIPLTNGYSDFEKLKTQLDIFFNNH